MQWRAMVSILLLGFLAACQAAQNPTAAGFAITAPAFVAGGYIPIQYTCQGANLSPEIAWGVPPEDTESLVLIVDDPDAQGGLWNHWIVYNIPPDARGLPENAAKQGLPQGVLQGITSFQNETYGGPCPPKGTHHYIFQLYALNIVIDTPGLDRAALLTKMQGTHILTKTQLIALYTKK